VKGIRVDVPAWAPPPAVSLIGWMI